jgi:hypothetical protein
MFGDVFEAGDGKYAQKEQRNEAIAVICITDLIRVVMAPQNPSWDANDGNVEDK